MAKWGFTTNILHADRKAGTEAGAVHQPVHTAVAYGYEDGRDLVAVFQGRQKGFLYGRQGNPTTAALQRKITLMEAGVASLVFATGMGAIAAMFMALFRQGDHIISSQFLFGNTHSLFDTLKQHGLKISLVDATQKEAVESAITPKTRAVFVETIANPCTQIADLEGIGECCRQHGLLYVVDNTMTSPWLFQPKQVGAGLVVNSLTKYLAGHARALGGAITDTGLFDWTQFSNLYPQYCQGDEALWGITQISKKGLRDTGASLSAEAAHNIAVGMETLALRLDRACDNARQLAQMLKAHPRVNKVYYPGLKSHPEHSRAVRLFRAPGALMSFEPSADVDIFALMDRLDLPIKSTNLGDNRTLIIPVAHTIYFEMGAENRKMMGIVDNLLRISVGIEDTADLLADFEDALS